MQLFRDDNTNGYTQNELDELNVEWEIIVTNEGIEENTGEYDQRAKEFSDEVASR